LRLGIDYRSELLVGVDLELEDMVLLMVEGCVTFQPAA
jgi:hypothetical protein